MGGNGEVLERQLEGMKIPWQINYIQEFLINKII